MPAVIRNMIRIWYFTASMGGVPARIWPVIMPGRLTMPAAAMALMMGIRPLRAASRRIWPMDSLQPCPIMRRASITRRCCQAVWVRRSKPKAIPVMVLPSSMPSSGMAYWGSHQGLGPIMVVSASTVTAKAETNMAEVPMP